MGTKNQTQAIIDAQASREEKLNREMQAKGEQYRAEHAGADQLTEVRTSHAEEREQKRVDSSESGRVMPAHERGTH